LRAQLNFDATAQVLLLERLVVPQEADDELADLSVLREERKTARVLDAGVVGHGSQAV
jgi:hypothetical protein